MKIRTKIYLFIFGATCVLAALLIISALSGFEVYSRATEQEHGRMAAELVRNELLMRFAQGHFDTTELLPTLQASIPALASVRLVRAKPVIDEYGEGAFGPPTEREREVLASRTVSERVVQGPDRVLYEYITPYFAEKTAHRNCLACHEVPEGTVLGAVNLKLDLGLFRALVFRSSVVIVLLLVTFAAALAYFLHRLLRPIVAATGEMQVVVGHAERGDFSRRMQVRSTDEIGRISRQTNHLMSILEDSFGEIVRDVERLAGQRAGTPPRDLLTHTVGVVRSMVDAARFRQILEEDRHVEEVYARLRQALEETLGIRHASLYEVEPDGDRLRTVFTLGLPEESEDALWCDPEVLVDGSACRVKRTSHEVSSAKRPGICAAFCANSVQSEIRFHHLCLPLMIGGGVGGILQVLFDQRAKQTIKDRLLTVRQYVEEAAPVIESKKLTQALEESAFKDPVTSVYNRRFLDQQLERLAALSDRRRKSLALLMCDIDRFKQLNDRFGHPEGDRVLSGTAAVIGGAIRQSDYVIRMGGDEFLAVLVESDADRATEVAERIRSRLQSQGFRLAGQAVESPVSIGVAVYPGDSGTLAECLEMADRALYAAKAAGGDRVVRYSPPPQEQERAG